MQIQKCEELKSRKHFFGKNECPTVHAAANGSTADVALHKSSTPSIAIWTDLKCNFNFISQNKWI